MFVLSHRNITLPADDGSAFTLTRGFMGNVQDKFCNTAYFKALVADGKISLPQTKKDRDIENAADSAEAAQTVARKRARAAAEQGAE